MDRQVELNKLACDRDRDGVLMADGCTECEENLEDGYIRLLNRNELLEAVYEAACETGLGSSEWANRLDIAIAAVEASETP